MSRTKWEVSPPVNSAGASDEPSAAGCVCSHIMIYMHLLDAPSIFTNIRCSVNIYVYIRCSMRIHAYVKSSINIHAYIRCSSNINSVDTIPPYQACMNAASNVCICTHIYIYIIYTYEYMHFGSSHFGSSSSQAVSGHFATVYIFYHLHLFSSSLP